MRSLNEKPSNIVSQIEHKIMNVLYQFTLMKTFLILRIQPTAKSQRLWGPNNGLRPNVKIVTNVRSEKKNTKRS